MSRPGVNGAVIWMADKIQGIVAVHQAQVADPSVLGKKPGAEDEIPHDEVVAVVPIRLVNQLRVVPPMQLGAAHKVVKQAVTHVDVRVLVEAVDGVEDEVQRDNLRADSNEDERQRVERVLEPFSTG